jgi:MFS family permease
MAPIRSRTWVPVALALLAVGWGANQFSPMLLVYRAELGLSAGDLALIFSLYAIGLIPGLLVGGPAADRYGRRRVVLPFVALSPVASALLIAFHHAPIGLGVARFLAGACSGVVFAGASAWLLELSEDGPSGTAARRTTIAMTAGFAAGPLATALLAQWAPAPLWLPYLPHVALGVLALAATLRTPETVTATTRRALLRLPSTARLPRFRRTIVPMAPWVFGSACLAFVVLPAQVSSAHSHSVAFAGVAAAMTAGAGVLVQPLGRRIEDRRPMRAAAVGLAAAVVGVAIGLVAVDAQSKALVLAGALPFGATYGLCLVAGLRETERLSPAHERAGSNALFLTLSYIGFGVPYAFAGLDQFIGTEAALLLFGAIAALTALASASGPQPLGEQQQPDERLRVVAYRDRLVQP